MKKFSVENVKSSEVCWWEKNTPVILAALAALGVIIFSLVWTYKVFNTTERGMEVNNLYLDALYREGQWVQSVSPGGVGGIHSPTAKKEADEAFQKLKQAVEALPPGDSVPLRVRQFIADGPIRPYVDASRK